MADLTYAELKGVWLRAAKGTKYDTNAWASLMAAIAEAESGGDPLITNPNDNNGTQTSWGLWQISNGTHSPPGPAWSDPVTNAHMAIAKLNNPNPVDARTGPGGIVAGLGAWGTYNTGAYKAFLSGKTTADLTSAGGPSAVATASATADAQAAQTCLYGFSGTSFHNIGLGPIHGPSNVGAFCVISRSQARAVVGGALLLGGLLYVNLGVLWMLKAAAQGAVLAAVGPALSSLVPSGKAAKAAGFTANATTAPPTATPQPATARSGVPPQRLSP